MWLTVKELASYIKVKEKTLYSLVARRDIPHYRINKLIRFKQEEIDSWLESKKATSFHAHVDKITRSIYTSLKGRPDHLGKGV